MAGDGGNDCGGLRAAHAGLALSDAEALGVGEGYKDTRQPTGSFFMIGAYVNIIDPI